MKKRKLFLALALFAMTQTWAQTEWSNATALPTAAGSYKLTCDVTLTETWEAPAGETTLDLNDHIIRRAFANDNERGTVIYIEEGNTLTIEDNASAKTTRYWERGTYKEWTNPQTSGSGDYKTVGGCITGGRGDKVNVVEGKLNFKLRMTVPEGYVTYRLNGEQRDGSHYTGGGIVNGGTLNLNGGNVVGNRIVHTFPSGGGILNGGTMTIGESAAVLGNACYCSLPIGGDNKGFVYGSGVYNCFIAKSCVNNGRIEYNHLEVPEGVEGVEIYGVGVFTLSETDFINNGSISYNTASNDPQSNIYGVGLAVRHYNNPELGITSAVNNGVIDHNYAYLGKTCGGGVTVSSHGTFTNKGTISNNVANIAGGVYVYYSTFTNKGTISNNVANTAGGGVYVYYSTFTNDGTITENVGAPGGGVAVYSHGTFTNKGTISNNVSNTAGGGVLVHTATFINNGTITENVGAQGGGVNVNQLGVFVNTGTISNNTATAYGGGVMSSRSATSVTFNAGTKITGNMALDEYEVVSVQKGFGGGIYTNSANPITIDNGSGTIEISGNKAAHGGGGVYLNNAGVTLSSSASGKLILTGNTLTDGTTASNALLYGENAKININDANSLKNAATKIGVGIRKTATDATFTPASGVVTTGYGKHSTEVLERFQLDEPLYEGTLLDIYKNNDNEVEIGLKVNDTGSNDAGLLAYDGETVGVKLSRTLIGDGYYNTICLPFDVDNATLKKRFGNDVELKQLDKSVAGSNAIDMTMVFTSASEIEAGKPYLIKVSEDVVDPTFTDVTIKNTLQPKETELCTFVPVFNQTRLENDNKKILFLDAGNTLTWPSSEKYTADFRGLRCYFLLKNEVGAGIGSAKTFRLVFDGETTVIENVNVNANDNGILYNLQGQRVNKAVNGIYIKNGKKFVK